METKKHPKISSKQFLTLISKKYKNSCRAKNMYKIRSMAKFGQILVRDNKVPEGLDI